MRQRGFTSIPIIIVLVLVAGVIGGAYYLGTQKNISGQANSLKQPESTSTLKSNPSPSAKGDKSSRNSGKTFVTTGINNGLTLKYPADWVTPEGMFISEKTFVAGEQDRNKVYNIIEVQKYATQLYEGYTNAEWFNKVNNLTSPDSDQRETRTKLASGKVASGESYVIFKDEPSSTAQGEVFKQVKAYILKDQTIYQLTLDLYDDSGLEIFKQIVASSVIN
jgi:hypothetical protein